jgi:cysteine synthase A
MSKLYSKMPDLIGNTPIVKINSLGCDNLWAKVEYFNPAGSIKDRIAYNMLQEAIKRGEIGKDTIIVEPTSGNTGVGLAFCCSVLGNKFIATMPENMTQERIKLIQAYGAEIVLTPKENGMKGSVDRAYEITDDLKADGKKVYMPMQFENLDNPKAHFKTAEEIFEDTDGKVDVVVAGIGTGGTISGIAQRLKELKPKIKAIGVEAFESPLLTKGQAGAHCIQGISANFIPKTLNKALIDEIIDVKGSYATEIARQVAHDEGLLIGISAGAALYAAREIAKRDNSMVVAILPDCGERYLSGDLYE